MTERPGLARRIWDWFLYRRRRLVAACVVIAVLLAALVVGGAYLSGSQPPWTSCGVDGVAHLRNGRECVGATAAEYDFSPRFRVVDRLIRAEDDRVGTGRDVVTVAVLLPMTGMDTTVALHAIEGAYVAQYRANHLNSEAPRIRLVLANPGSQSQYWKRVVKQLKAMTAAPDNLRAVTGISVSTANTRNEVRWLTRHGVPVVSDTTTAEDIANPTGNSDRYPGLARITPTDMDAARALGHVVDVDPKRALVVEDTRTDDDYIASLRRIFTAETAAAPYQPVQFTSPKSVNAEGRTPNQFVQDTTTICQLDPRYIYFAGRHVQLRQFLDELGKNCPTRAFTVLGGTDARRVLDDRKLHRNVFGPDRITLEYPAMATPLAWTGAALDQTAPYASGYRAFLSAAAKAFPSHEALDAADLSDAEALLSHDAVWTVRQALVLLIGVEQDGAGRLPSTGDVAGEWKQLRGRYKVEGASGWVCLDNGGNPWNKGTPIVRFDQSGPHFQELAWPEGHPPGSVCSA